MTTTSFGASIGRGPVHCVMLELDDGRIVGQQARTIDPGPYRLGRRSDLLASGFDLLVGHTEAAVDASAVAVRTRRDLFAAKLGTRGELRSAEVVREVDAVLRALDDSGVIARYAVALVADIGAGGMRVHTIADGAVEDTARTTGVAVSGVEPGLGTPAAAADFVRRVIKVAAVRPEAIVLIGGGAQHATVREAIGDVAESNGLEVVGVDEPEALAAIGAALLAADRLTGAVPAAPSRLGSGLGVLGGHSVRLTAAVLPALVVAALAFAVLVATYATGIIGPTGDSTDRSPSPAFTSSDTLQGETTTEEVLPTTTSTLAGVDVRVSTTAPQEVPREEVTVPPVMTTFAPPPTATQPTRVPDRTTTRPVPTTPGTPWPTVLLPTPPTGTGTPSSSTDPSVPVAPTTGGATGTPTVPSGTPEAPRGPAVGGGAAPREGMLMAPEQSSSVPRQPARIEVVPEAAPTVTAPAA
ncbi:putative protein OS=Tsukamurella paurometabola (strain ATCC 8368 / DSM / CCUG 35730 /CIP 100753 / JCM 10117 / KCTC 9821 / NBRC 16120 / NCIMB 702349/ NCTC 13040) OX=521096 GN=Tpau_0943 PE=4 SV=1 [Tsukamurella paurometabola]|uniref:Uncharacterized protein n=1 Tax=Tsukamurella paurometabola (strain ATCC 8368 / DSM 20162 / CCUG 35730 / CIP 100753 / JCM 10117 / KCTC 9821 / NBRC 16120 / NCIMB 702349 / NCTC 13040) TaxID=521096 RepID=D5UUK5_TSUPD|nr:hypothetical protein [Tsukamurella paurometabola]ADG77576.1 hypothetical protein Tpau_0943 [Tsukamurella paurometabola DSM 20162]SUP27778.1 Uncharacterised protein [Tsukamurella paurometabola]